MSMFIVRSLVLGLCAPALLASSAWAEETHTLTSAPAQAQVGAAGNVSLTIEGKNGWHINAEAPISVKLTPAAGVTVAKPKLNRADLALSTDTKARFDVSATLAEAGTKTIAAEAAFVVCQESACKPVKQSVTLTVSSPAAEAPKAKTKAKRKA